ncbi:MAG: endonuclease domain-containing protein [Candidatus Cloacimonadales bacterium]|nr:endonuclease domain-containing protein [Candidatus Cloacimonadales bacterium]
MKVAFETARDLRKRNTVAEDAFWQMVRNRRFYDFKLKRQCPIEFEYEDGKRFFIADFYCHEKKLVVEIDGGIHEFHKEYDKQRDEMMTILGLKIIRFSNLEVLNNLDNVKVELKRILSS